MNLLQAENGAAGGVRFSTPPMDGDENGQMGDGPEEFVGAEDGGYALVINGDSLGHALKRKYEKTFLEIGCSCAVNIPSQMGQGQFGAVLITHRGLNQF
jgi:hypothetical protein